MDKWIIAHSGALRVFSYLIAPLAIALIITVVLLVIIKIRQVSNQRLESSKGNTRFAQACSRLIAAAGRASSRNPVGSASGITRRMSSPASRTDHRPPELRPSGPIQRHTATNPVPHGVSPRITAEDDGVIEICMEYLEEYRI